MRLFVSKRKNISDCTGFFQHIAILKKQTLSYDAFSSYEFKRIGKMKYFKHYQLYQGGYSFHIVYSSVNILVFCLYHYLKNNRLHCDEILRLIENYIN